jgi:hypothetical protein
MCLLQLKKIQWQGQAQKQVEEYLEGTADIGQN